MLDSARAAPERPRFELAWLEQAPFLSLCEAFRRKLASLGAWPNPEAYDDIVRATATEVDGGEQACERPRFVSHDRVAVAFRGGYEAYVAAERAVPTRPFHWHDFFNMAVWAHLPRLRWALNTIHTTAGPGQVDPRNGRTPQQNRAAHFDETGLLVMSQDPGVLNDLAELRFKRVFWERRRELSDSTRFLLCGHGSMEALLAPRVGLMSKALLVELGELPPHDARGLRDIDRLLSERVQRWRVKPDTLHPVPLLGVPGYHAGQSSRFYDNARYFRARRSKRSQAERGS